jgi:hypothetical protein
MVAVGIVESVSGSATVHGVETGPGVLGGGPPRLIDEGHHSTGGVTPNAFKPITPSIARFAREHFNGHLCVRRAEEL